jgi:hypothetical protein
MMQDPNEAAALDEPAPDAMALETPGKVIPREAPTDVDPARAAKVGWWLDTIRQDRAHWGPEFARIRLGMQFAKMGASADWVEAKNYVANVIQRQVNNRVSELYAKNPRAVASVRPRLNFKVWGGDPNELMVAQQSLAMNPNPMDPANQPAMELIQDVTDGMQQQKLYERIARTLELSFRYFQDEQSPTFKKQAKRAVRRSLVAGVAYCEIGFQRIMETQPEVSAEIESTARRLATLESLAADLADEQMQGGDAEMETLRVLLSDLQNRENLIVREGPTFDWGIGATEIIPDRNCRQLNGFVGAGHVSREYYWTAAQIQEEWKVDIRSGARSGGTNNGDMTPIVTEDGAGGSSGGVDAKSRYHVWRVWDKRTGTEFVVAEGWPDYIKEPSAPIVQVDGFWPVLVLEFNPVEDADTPADKNDGIARRRIHGLSDVELLRDMQDEYNRARQGLREHRRANRPGHFTAKGSLDEQDKARLSSHAAHDVIELNGLAPGQKVADLLQPKPSNPIDSALYDTGPTFEDIQRASGSQDANFGNLSGATATEASIAEGGRQGASQSNIDDLDDLLTELARKTGQVLLLNMSADQITKIVGPGAAWPEFSAQEASEEIFLSIKAGSSGRPNRELELANIERVASFLVQLPGIQPRWLAEQVVRRLDDDTISLEDAFLEGLPSVAALNALQGSTAAGGGAGTGPQSDPAQQGGQGAQNQPQPAQHQAGPQAAFPSGQPGV